MASMVPYRSVFGVRPSASSLFDLFDDMTDLANNSIASKAFPVDVEDKGDGYEVKAYLTGVAKDDIDVELNEGRLSISVNVEESAENEGKNFLQKEFSSYSATRGVYLKDAPLSKNSAASDEPMKASAAHQQRGPRPKQTLTHSARYLETPKQGKSIFVSSSKRRKQHQLTILLLIIAAIAVALVIRFIFFK